MIRCEFRTLHIQKGSIVLKYFKKGAAMHPSQRLNILVFILILFIGTGSATAADTRSPGQDQPKETIALPGDMDAAMLREARKVRADLVHKTKSLFERQPLEWNKQTLVDLNRWFLDLPARVSQLTAYIIEHSRILGFAGSLLVLVLLAVILFGIFGQKKLITAIELKLAPIREKLPETVVPFFQSALRIAVAALIPLLLVGGYALVLALLKYTAPWLIFIGRLLWLWVLAALMIGLLRESLTRDLFDTTRLYGRRLFALSRLTVWYIIAGLAIFWGAAAFEIRPDVLALLKSIIALSFVIVLFLLFLQKKAVMSLLPQLPYKSYQWFLNGIDRFYIPLMLFSFLIGFLWCAGYQLLGQTVLSKVWFSLGAYLLLMTIYHGLSGKLQSWSSKTDPADEAARLLVRSSKTILLYATVLATAIIALNMLGLLGPLQQIMSFPVLQLGKSPISLWIIVKAALILMTFVFAARVLQAYLDYKIYPTLGIDTGLGYALNTFFKYLAYIIGFLISLRVVGIDLRFLLVFAGAIGIGVGLGLQNMAANIFAGFTIIFGQKIRKGDWIEVGQTLGVVTDIYVRATNVRTRDDIEYLVPNADLVNNTIVNYSLSSSLTRISLPVGVSYNADPRQVEMILLAVVEREPLISSRKEPAVRFVEYADNSINFELLIWIDIRNVARRRVRSNLYFAIFDEFKAAGIEIPFPQRDVHIRTQPA